MIEHEKLYNEVIQYLKSLGYGTEMVDYEISTPSDRLVDLVVRSGSDKLIAIEIKSQSDIFKIPHSEVSYHPVARKLQRNAIDIGAKYFFVTNGYQVVWLKTAENGRPQVIDPVYASEVRSNKLSNSEFINAIINHAVGFLENFPITGDIYFDLSLAIFTKIRSDIGLSIDLPIENHLNSSNEKDYNEKKSVLLEVLDRWDEIDFYNNRFEVLSFIDKYLGKNRFELQVTRWLSDFMINLYPENKTKDFALDLFARYGTLISSAHNNGWKEVKGLYFNKSNEYWIRSQQLLSSGRESSAEFDANLLSNDVPNKYKNYFDCVFLAPPFGLKVDSEYGFDKKGSVELLINKALVNVKDDGYVIVIVPDGMLLSSRYSKFRRLLLKNSYIKGIISLTPDAFKPFSTVSTSILVIQNKIIKNRDTFFASLEEVPVSYENNKTYDNIINNWKAFCTSSPFDSGKNGFLINELNPENLHFSNYWYKEYQDGMEKLHHGFQAIPLKEVSIEIQRGKTYKRDEKEEVPYLAPAVIRSMKLIDGELSYTSNELEPSNPVRAYENDIVINIIGTQRGSAAMVEKHYDGLGINHHLIVVRPNLQIVNPYYLAIALNSDYVQNQLQEGSTGTVIPALSLKSFESIYIPIPPLFAQNKICENYRMLSEELDKKEKELNENKLKLKMIMSEIGKEEQI